ncbi:MAG: BCD family MFS transporter [Methylocystis sp.]
MNASSLSWLGIVRLGLVQTSLGAVVVLMTSTINRVMVVELALPAFVPGLLVASHYAVQLLRPAWGYRADVGGRRTPWVILGMAALALGGTGAAVGTAMTASRPSTGLLCATLSFLVVGLGVGAAGTSVMAMLATRVAPERRAGAATTVWVMMIFGFALTAPLAGHFLDPFSKMRLVAVTASVSTIAFCVATLAIWGLEKGVAGSAATKTEKPPFREAFLQVWAEPEARRFTIFIFVSMLAYSAQELLVEPFAGVVFGMTPGTTTKLAGLQHGGVLLGMLIVPICASPIGGPIFGSLRLFTIGGCLASALALAAVAGSGYVGQGDLLRICVFALGFSNGVFAVAAIGSMMGLAGAGARSREGTRMGLWGAAQAIAFGLGGVLATILVDATRLLVGAPLAAYALVFLLEAVLFLVSAVMAGRIARPERGPSHAPAGLRLGPSQASNI